MLFESLKLKCSWLVIIIFPHFPVIGQSDHRHLPSSIFFKIRERDAHIESIAYDSASRIFYLGSIHKHKIIQRKPDGSVSDFKAEGQDSLYSVLGLRVDPIRHWLWACTSPLAEMEGVGFALTITFLDAVPVHPFPSVTVTT